MRPSPFHFANTRLLRQLIVWVLVLALPLNSLSTVLTHLLGAAHSHGGSEPVVMNASSSWSPRELLRAVVGNGAMALIDGAHLRERGLQVPAHFVFESDAHSLEHQHGTGDQVHTHLHGMFERHFHDPSDGSVVVLGAKASGQDAPGNSHGIDEGSVALLPLATLTPMLYFAQCGSVWLHGIRMAWRSHVTAPLERPPRR
jgi:hypothetical protein